MRLGALVVHFFLAFIAVIPDLAFGDFDHDIAYTSACSSACSCSGQTSVAFASYWCAAAWISCPCPHPSYAAGASQSRSELHCPSVCRDGIHKTALAMSHLLQDGQAFYATMCMVWQNMAGSHGLHLSTWLRSAPATACGIGGLESSWTGQCPRTQAHAQKEVTERQARWWFSSTKWSTARSTRSCYTLLSAWQLGTKSRQWAICAPSDASAPSCATAELCSATPAAPSTGTSACARPILDTADESNAGPQRSTNGGNELYTICGRAPPTEHLGSLAPFRGDLDSGGSTSSSESGPNQSSTQSWPSPCQCARDWTSQDRSCRSRSGPLAADYIMENFSPIQRVSMEGICQPLPVPGDRHSESDHSCQSPTGTGPASVWQNVRSCARWLYSDLGRRGWHRQLRVEAGQRRGDEVRGRHKIAAGLSQVVDSLQQLSDQAEAEERKAKRLRSSGDTPPGEAPAPSSTPAQLPSMQPFGTPGVK